MSAGNSSHGSRGVGAAHPADSIALGHLPLSSWCPQLVGLIKRTYSANTADFLLSLPRKPAALRDHSGCTKTLCVANDTNLAEGGSYISAHWKSCTGDLVACPLLGPDPEKVRKIIREGGIPLVSIECDKSGVVHVDAIAATARSKYFAISHVWSGGLGNPKSNELPLCQLKRLFDLWHELAPESEGPNCVLGRRWAKKIWRQSRPQRVLFWMDTLCIPVGRNYDDLKMRAINSMAKTYANAEAIVILDHELQQTNHLSMSEVQRMGLLACSAWMSRCWTLQEGALAKQWLVQFEDGIWCPENFQKVANSSPEAHQLNWYFGWLLQQDVGEHQKLFQDNNFRFQRVWHSLCTRSTTKREDLVSIIAIMLAFRPAGILRLPKAERILSLICAQDTLPLSILYRKRAAIRDWSEARQWLPWDLEECPVLFDECVMWRRACEEDFFVLKFHSPKASNHKTRLYFAQTIGEMSTSELRLIDEGTQENITINFLLSPALRLPQLEVCIIFGYIASTIHAGNDIYGACLGVRHRDAGRVQLYYICPVKVSVHPLGLIHEDTTQTKVTTRVNQEHMSSGTEFVIEYNFPKAVILSESRISTDKWVTRGFVIVVLLTFAIYFLFYDLASVYITLGREDDPWFSGNKEYLLILRLFIARFMGFIFEFIILLSGLKESESDDWYGGLCGDRIFLDVPSLYIHPRTSIVSGILGLGILACPIFLFPERLAISWPVYLISLFIELEVAFLALRWFIELYATTAPRKFNIILCIATASGAPPIQIQRIDLIFKRFFAPSKMTIFARRILDTILSATRVRVEASEPPDLVDEHPELTTRALRMSESWEPANQHSPCVLEALEPWNRTEVKIFDACTNYQNLRYTNSMSTISLPEDHLGYHIDDSHKYLCYMLLQPKFLCFAYWTLSSLVSSIFLFGNPLFNGYGGYVASFTIIMGVSTGINLCLCLFVSVSAGLLSKMFISFQIRFSVHFGVVTTTVLLCACIPLAMLMCAPLPAQLVPFSLCASFILGGLGMLWFAEVLGRNYPGIIILVGLYEHFGEGNEALDECYRRVYSKSRLTRWVEVAFKVIYTDFKNWCRWLVARRQRGYSDYSTSQEEGRIRINTDTRGDYADDGDENNGNLLVLDVEGE